MFSRLLGISPSLLKKLLIVASGGGGSIFYFGFPESFVFGTNRKVKWTLKSVGGRRRNESIERKDDRWVTNKQKWQGLELEQWDKVSDNGVKTIYKLILKKEFIKEELAEGNNQVQGALGLFKVNLQQDKREGGKVKLEEISDQEAKSVWLIVAKGKGGSIYLMPVVRATKDKLGHYSLMASNCLQKISDIWYSGISNLNSLSNDEMLKEREVSQLKETLKDGFVIGRRGEVSPKPRRGGGSMLLSFIDRRSGNPERGKQVVYRNAGILAPKSNRQKVCLQNNDEVRYFPLDIKGIGETKMEEIKGRDKATWSEIEVKETIEDVGIFRWDKLRVSETGIGDGVGKDVIWGTNNKIAWTPELLK